MMIFTVIQNWSHKHESGETQTCKEPLNIPLALAESFHGIRTGCHCRSDSRSPVAALSAGATDGCMSVSRVKKWTTCLPVDLCKHQESKPIPKPFRLSLSMNNTFCVFRGSRGSVWSLWYKTVERLVSFCGFLCHDVPLTLPWVSFLNRNTATRVNQPLDTDSVGTVGLWVPFGSTQRDPPWATSSCSDLGPGATREVSCANVTISTGFSGSPTRIHTSDSLTRLQMWWFAEHGFHYHAQVSQEVHLWMIKISRNKWCTHTPRGRAPVTSCAFLLWLSVQVWTTWVAKHTGGMGAALQNVAAEQQLWVPLAEFDDLEVSQNRGILSHPQFDHLMRRFLQCFGFGGFSQRHWWHISLETWSLLSIRGSSTSWCLATMDSVWSWANRPWPGQILGKPPPQAMKQQTLSRMGRTHETCAKKWRSQPRRGWQNNDNTTKCCLSSRLVADVHLTILRLQIWLLAGPMLADVLEPQGTETEWQFFVLSVSTPSFVFLQLDNLFGMFFFDFPCEFLLNWVISCYFCGTLGCGSTTCELQQQLCPKPISILSCSMCIIADV